MVEADGVVADNELVGIWGEGGLTRGATMCDLGHVANQIEERTLVEE